MIHNITILSISHFQTNPWGVGPKNRGPNKKTIPKPWCFVFLPFFETHLPEVPWPILPHQCHSTLQPKQDIENLRWDRLTDFVFTNAFRLPKICRRKKISGETHGLVPRCGWVLSVGGLINSGFFWHIEDIKNPWFFSWRGIFLISLRRLL